MKTKINPVVQALLFRAVQKPSRRAVAGGLVLLVLLAASCGRKPDPSVLARVGSSEVRAEQFQDQLIRRGGTQPEKLDREALLQEMVEQEVLYLRALKAGLDRDPELLRTWRSLMIAALKERELSPRLAKAEVTQEELEAAYQAGGDRHARPAAVRVAMLYLQAGPVAKPAKTAELQRRMTAAREKALAQEPCSPGFGALAVSCSEDQATRYSGGVVGWIEQDRGHAWIGPAVIETAFALRSAGEISEVITDTNGVFLLKLLERREAAVVPLADIEPSLRQRLLSEKRRLIEREFMRESRGAIPVEMHPELLAQIPLPASTPLAGSQQPPVFP